MRYRKMFAFIYSYLIILYGINSVSPKRRQFFAEAHRRKRVFPELRPIFRKRKTVGVGKGPARGRGRVFRWRHRFLSLKIDMGHVLVNCHLHCEYARCAESKFAMPLYNECGKSSRGFWLRDVFEWNCILYFLQSWYFALDYFDDTKGFAEQWFCQAGVGRKNCPR